MIGRDHIKKMMGNQNNIDSRPSRLGLAAPGGMAGIFMLLSALFQGTLPHKLFRKEWKNNVEWIS